MDIHERIAEAAPIFGAHARALTKDLDIAPSFVRNSGGWCQTRVAHGFRLTETVTTLSDTVRYRHIVEGYEADPPWELLLGISIGESGEFDYGIIDGGGCRDEDQPTQMNELLFKVLPGNIYTMFVDGGAITVDADLFARITEAVNDLLQRTVQGRAA